MWNKKILTQTIKDNLASGNYEAVENACRIAFEKGGLSESEKRFIKDGFIPVIQNSKGNNDLDNAIILYEYIRILNPDDFGIVLKQLTTLKDFFEVNKKDFVYDDLYILDAILSLLIDQYKTPEKIEHFTPAIEIEIDLRRKIHKRIPKAKRLEESKLSYRLNKILNAYASLKFSNLTPEERKKEFAKRFSEGVKRVIKKTQIKPNKKSK